MSRFSIKFVACAVIAGFYAMGPCFGSDNASIADWLAKPILAADQPQVEIERYLESRIPRLPELTTREAWERDAQRIREDMLSKVILRGQGLAWRDAPLKIDWQEVIHGGDDYRIKKLRFEALPGLWIPALLYEPLECNQPMPVSLAINGHDPNGKAADYKQIRCINQAKRGMLVLNVEWLGMGQLRSKGYAHTRMNQLDLCGTCGMAPFYLAMKRGLDILLAHPHADSSRVAVSGLSGGGWQTIFISSLDTRVTLANPVAGYSSFLTRIHHHTDLGDSEQTPNDMATVGDYAHLTALLAPRAVLLTYNEKDNCCFASGHALQPLLDAATPIYRLLGQESRIRSHINYDPGTHNFERDNREAFYQMLVEHFFAGQRGANAIEMECQSEVKSAEELHVSLPPQNADFNSLAKQLAKTLPQDAALPTDGSAAVAWQQQKRQLLKDTIRARDYTVAAETVHEANSGEFTVRMWRLRLGDTWTVPAVEILGKSPEPPKRTTILTAEGGRAGLQATVQELVNSGQRVVAVDPFYLGESKFKTRAYLWALLVQTVGDRPAGLQASQLIAVAKWLKQEHPNESITLDARGVRLSLAALCAAALDPEAINQVHVDGSLASFKDVMTDDYGFDTHPELFVFGLLERFDVQTIAALTAPREVRFVAAGERHRHELAGLPTWYKLLGKEFDPLK